MLKEKLIIMFWKKLSEENRDKDPPADQKNEGSDHEIDGGNSIDSTKASTNTGNTPKAKSLGQAKEKKATETAVAEIDNFMLPTSNVIYKYFIGKGNNSIMVRSLFKNRFWWVCGDNNETEKGNFCWT